MAEGDSNSTKTRRDDRTTRNNIQPARLPRGSAGQTLFSGGFDLEWKYPGDSPNT